MHRYTLYICVVYCIHMGVRAALECMPYVCCTVAAATDQVFCYLSNNGSLNSHLLTHTLSLSLHQVLLSGHSCSELCEMIYDSASSTYILVISELPGNKRRYNHGFAHLGLIIPFGAYVQLVHAYICILVSPRVGGSKVPPRTLYRMKCVLAEHFIQTANYYKKTCRWHSAVTQIT